MQTTAHHHRSGHHDALLGFHLEDGRFISVPLDFYPTLALATPSERARSRVNGSSGFWPDLDADIGVDGLLCRCPRASLLRPQGR